MIFQITKMSRKHFYSYQIISYITSLYLDKNDPITYFIPLDLFQLLQKYNLSLQDIDRVCSDTDDIFLEFTVRSDVSKKIKLIEDDFEAVAHKTCNTSEKQTYLTIIRNFLIRGDKSGAESIVKYAKDDVNSVSQACLKKCVDNWDKMSDSEKREIAYVLKKKCQDVRQAYTSLIDKLCVSFVDRGVQTSRVRMVASSYNYSEGCFELSKDDDMFTVFRAFLPRNPWFNFELFSIFVKVIGTQKEKELFQDYMQNTLIPYLRQCIFLIPFEQGICRQQASSFFLKVVDDILLTGLEVKTTQHYLADLLGLSHSAFVFEFYKWGCFELFFYVSTETFDPMQSQYLDWDPSKQAYRVTADLVTIL